MSPTGAIFSGKEGSIYLLTLTNPRSRAWQLAGVFLDPSAAKNAKAYLIDKGIDERLIAIDQAPIGIVSLSGIDEPYRDQLPN